MQLINCEVSLILTWNANCVITTKANGKAIPLRENNPTGTTSKITDTKF